MRTKIYTVHYREEAKGSLTGLGEDAILVKEGFSWPAFFFAPVWLVWKRMWIVLALFVAAEIGIVALTVSAWLPDDAVAVISFAVHVLLGFQGNDLYRWSLNRRRYRERGVVAGPNLEAAEQRLFASLAEARPV